MLLYSIQTTYNYTYISVLGTNNGAHAMECDYMCLRDSNCIMNSVFLFYHTKYLILLQ